MTTTATPTRLDAFNTLGHPLLSTTSAEKALKDSGLFGWNVRKAPAQCIDTTTGEVVEMPGTSGVIYDHPGGGVRYLGRVGNVHDIIQNEEQIELLQIFVDEAGATFETAGVAKGGARVFVTMKLPGNLNVGGDRVDMYVASINAHDGNASHVLMKTPMRFACMNMLNVAIAGAKASDRMDTFLKVRHTRGAQATLKRQAQAMVENTFEYMERFRATADKLANTTMTQREFEKIIATEFGPKDDAAPAAVTRAENKLEIMAHLFSEANTQAGIRDTAWAGFNALTEYNDHFAPVTGEDRELRRATKAILDNGFKNYALELMLGVASR